MSRLCASWRDVLTSLPRVPHRKYNQCDCLAHVRVAYQPAILHSIESNAVDSNEKKKTQSKRRTWGSGKNLRSMNTTTPRAVKCDTRHTTHSLLIFSYFFYRATVWCVCLVCVAFTFLVIRPFRGSLCVILPSHIIMVPNHCGDKSTINKTKTMCPPAYLMRYVCCWWWF